MANIIGVVSALAAISDTELTEHRKYISRFERMLDREHISREVAKATMEYLRISLSRPDVDVDGLPLSVRTRIRTELYGDLLTTLPLFHGTSDRFIRECITLVKEDSFVKGLDIVRRGDLGGRLIIIIDGHATLEVMTEDLDASLTFDNSQAHMQKMADKEFSVAILHARACFGTEGFVSGLAQPFTVRAQTLLRVVSIDDEDRRELERTHPNDWSKLRANLINLTDSLRTAGETILTQIAQGTAADYRLKVDRLRLSLEKATLVPESCARNLVDVTEKVIESVKRDASGASHALSALHCHVAGTVDVKELRRLLDLVPVSEVPGDYDGAS